MPIRLFPQHLRDRQHAEIIRRRTYGIRTDGEIQGSAFGLTPLPEPKMGFLGRYWAKGSGLTEKQAKTGLPAASMTTLSAVWLPGALIGPISMMLTGVMYLKHGNADPLLASAVATAGLSVLGAFPWAKAAFKWCYKDPLSEGEIDHLLKSETTAVERDYLQLVRDAIRQTTNVTPEVEAEIQAAIVSLGEAVDRLPVVKVQALDTRALREEANAIYAQSKAEMDRVISESLERRADAILRRAEANEKSSVAVQRTAALYAEIEAQIAALREAVATLSTGYGVSDSGTAQNLQYLSESARRLAAEAISAESARIELDAPIRTDVRSYTDSSTATPPVNTVGRSGQ